MRFFCRTLLAFVALHLTVQMGMAAEKNEPRYETDIRPIFKAYCFHCHGEEEHPEGSLDLRLVRLMLKGGDSGASIVPGKPEESVLWERVKADEMPEGDTKLSPEQKETLRQWIITGAKTLRPEPEDPAEAAITEEERSHWAFQPIVRPKLPTITGQDLPNPIDSFIAEKLQTKKLPFSPEADKATLLRRVYFDLIGLPPSPSDVEGFLADESPDAYQKVIETLLDSPAYGERWGRHWLDVVGYSESDIIEGEDQLRDDAFRYRDYVIKSFNEDKPFDRFIQEQLAGDEIAMTKGLWPTKFVSPETSELLAATGYLRMIHDPTAKDDSLTMRNKVLSDALSVVSTSLLGMTIACAQCHDHRFDPLVQDDYYRLQAVFEPVYDLDHWRAPKERKVSLYSQLENERAIGVEMGAKAWLADIDRRVKEDLDRIFEKRLKDVPEVDQALVKKARDTKPSEQTDEQKAILEKYPKANVVGPLKKFDSALDKKYREEKKQIEKLRESKPHEGFLLVANETGKIPETHVFHRGNPEAKGRRITDGEIGEFLVLNATYREAQIKENDPRVNTSGRRLAFAEYLTTGRHPLVARVQVNRIWMHHFGRGIVSTVGDFGVQGTHPTHPELLDFLADEFMQTGWSVKSLHRLIMTSIAYRQSSKRTAELDAIDPNNDLFGRQNLRRLEAEIIRDAVLAASGSLNEEMFGPSVPVCISDEGYGIIGTRKMTDIGHMLEVIPVGDAEFRRSIYLQSRRNLPLPMLQTFDMPTMRPNCTYRTVSTIAPQALVFMNDDFVIHESEKMARELRQQFPDSLEKQIRQAWLILFSEQPDSSELSAEVAYVHSQHKPLADGLERTRLDWEAYLARPKTSIDEQHTHLNIKRTPPREIDIETACLASLIQALMGSNQFIYVD